MPSTPLPVSTFAADAAASGVWPRPAPIVEASDSALLLTLVLMAFAAGGLIAWSTVQAYRRGTWIPLLALLGGVVALPIEPFWDVNVLFTFATNSHPIAFTAFGRDIPVYLALIYPAFIGWGSYISYRQIRKGASGAAVFWVSALFFPLDALIEVVGQESGVWSYYGPHSWNPLGWPMYFGILNASITLIGGAMLVTIEDRLHSVTKNIALVLAVPSAYVGIYAVAGWPTWAALNAEVPRAVVWIAGATTMTVAVGICWYVACAVSTGVASERSTAVATPTRRSAERT